VLIFETVEEFVFWYGKYYEKFKPRDCVLVEGESFNNALSAKEAIIDSSWALKGFDQM
jgi:hypothetical protein